MHGFQKIFDVLIENTHSHAVFMVSKTLHSKNINSLPNRSTGIMQHPLAKGPSCSLRRYLFYKLILQVVWKGKGTKTGNTNLKNKNKDRKKLQYWTLGLTRKPQQSKQW